MLSSGLATLLPLVCFQDSESLIHRVYKFDMTPSLLPSSPGTCLSQDQCARQSARQSPGLILTKPSPQYLYKPHTYLPRTVTKLKKNKMSKHVGFNSRKRTWVNDLDTPAESSCSSFTASLSSTTSTRRCIRPARAPTYYVRSHEDAAFQVSQNRIVDPASIPAWALRSRSPRLPPGQELGRPVCAGQLCW